MIPYGRQDISDADIDAVIQVLKSDFLTQGNQNPAFEDVVSSFVNARHAVAVNSATSALHIACLALGLGQDDWLWTSAISFVASANCGRYCGAFVDFVDIDPLTHNMCMEALEHKLEAAQKIGKLPKIVIPVHLSGLPCDMQKIKRLSNEYGFNIIEDASHAIGAKYKETYVGNCLYSDITVFSFHPVKIITTAEGGMALTNDSSLAEKMRLLRSHGVTRDASQMRKKPDGAWYYQQIDLGFNYRMTDLQAALGISQMHRLNEYITRRHFLADRYDVLLKGLPICLPYRSPDSFSSFHLYIIKLNLEEISSTHRQVFDYLRDSEIGVNIHYIPIHTQPYYQDLGFGEGDFPQAERYYSCAISLPLYPNLTIQEQNYIVEKLNNALLL